MKTSISNIAWDQKDDIKIYEIMQKYGFTGLDVAPSRVSDNPMEISQKKGRQFVESIGKWGIRPVGMQSLLFGTDGMALFEGQEVRERTVAHLKEMISFAHKIGITRLVFGSPKNRLIGNQSIKSLEELAYEVFNELGDYASAKNIYFCIEPNPIEYGADYITNTKEGIELVKKINNPGFRLHMDLGTMIVNNEDIEEVVAQGIGVTEHIHISHPFLEPVIGREDIHTRFFNALVQNGYNKTVAIEMKNSNQPNNVDRIIASMCYISSVYGDNISG